MDGTNSAFHVMLCFLCVCDIRKLCAIQYLIKRVFIFIRSMQTPIITRYTYLEANIGTDFRIYFKSKIIKSIMSKSKMFNASWFIRDQLFHIFSNISVWARETYTEKKKFEVKCSCIISPFQLTRITKKSKPYNFACCMPVNIIKKKKIAYPSYDFPEQ